MAAASAETAAELARRVVLLLLHNPNGEFYYSHVEDALIVSILAELVSQIIQRTLRVADSYSKHAHRAQPNIFDILVALREAKTSLAGIATYVKTRVAGRKATMQIRCGALAPIPRNLLRGLGDEDEEEEDEDNGVGDEDDEEEEGGRYGDGNGSRNGRASGTAIRRQEGGEGDTMMMMMRKMLVDGGDQALRPAYILDIYPPFPRPYTYRQSETVGVRETDKVLVAKAKAEQQRQVEQNLYRLLTLTKQLRGVINYEEDF